MRYSYKSVTIGSTVFVPELMDIFLGGSDLATHKHSPHLDVSFHEQVKFFRLPFELASWDRLC